MFDPKTSKTQLRASYKSLEEAVNLQSKASRYVGKCAYPDLEFNQNSENLIQDNNKREL
jgi:hypothetical protein